MGDNLKIFRFVKACDTESYFVQSSHEWSNNKVRNKKGYMMGHKDINLECYVDAVMLVADNEVSL